MRLDQSKTRGAVQQKRIRVLRLEDRPAIQLLEAEPTLTQTQQQAQYRNILAKEFRAAIGNYRSSYTDLFGNTGGSVNKGHADAGLINFGDNIGTLPLPPNDSPVGLSAAQLQRKPSESPEEHIARITALLNTVAEAMAIAVIEQKRKLRDRKVNNPKMKL